MYSYINKQNILPSNNEENGRDLQQIEMGILENAIPRKWNNKHKVMIKSFAILASEL